MPTVLVVGASRGLGANLAAEYSTHPDTHVLATTRSKEASELPASANAKSVSWITEVDIAQKECGPDLARKCKSEGSTTIDTVIIVAGFLGKESFDEPDWDAEVKMYTISAIGPVFLVQALVKASVVVKGAKIVLVTSEAGSINLRHPKEGGGMYAHHASKTAENMVGRLLSLDLEDKEIGVVMVHPGFMRTEMTRGAGFDKFWEDGGAVTPDVAAHQLIEWLEKDYKPEMSGQFWAPRGSKDIGTAEDTLGKTTTSPVQLPW